MAVKTTNSGIANHDYFLCEECTGRYALFAKVILEFMTMLEVQWVYERVYLLLGFA